MSLWDCIKISLLFLSKFGVCIYVYVKIEFINDFIWKYKSFREIGLFLKNVIWLEIESDN